LIIAASITTTDLAIYLGIYASVVSTAAGLWALFSGVFRDRARIQVKASEAYFVVTPKGQFVVTAEDTLQTMGVKPHQRREILRVVVRNRGRRPAKIEQAGQATLKGAMLFGDFSGQVPFELDAESSRTLVIGADGGYAHGEIRARRFFVEDGAGRKHPLRARWRLRLETVAYRWVLHLYWWHWRRKQRRERLAQRRDK
jgi:hypothetical protein